MSNGGSLNIEWFLIFYHLVILYVFRFYSRALKFELWRSGVEVSLGEDPIWWQLFVSELTLVTDPMTDRDWKLSTSTWVYPWI